MADSDNERYHEWSPAEYMKYSNFRTQAAQGLIRRLADQFGEDYLPNVNTVIELGSGPGNSTAELARSCPNARIICVDRSDNMLVAAMEANLGPNVEFVQGDLEHYILEAGADLIFSTNALHWLRKDTRIEILQRMFKSLCPGGVLAVHMPDNVRQPAHDEMRATARITFMEWSDDFHDRELRFFREKLDVDPVGEAFIYHLALKKLEDAPIMSFQHWIDFPQYRFASTRDIVDWMKGAELRPYLDEISNDNIREAYLSEYESRLKAHYPTNTLLSTQKSFVAVREM
ncbi:S-adenosyl-L-methionine-dependent methyltransferase [Podospora didyma]|uniref:S-adenosyl-L-methionine-dependent methyltransferase n=1 Tax=Podospora didyma TaxID=330526 RepID=A0AAE0TVI5_9PEZI|nr:S-adenosyl-L-methionine-dependent methyltransferase [Podospora didyma]